MDAFPTLINAAREFIEARLETIQANASGVYTPEDRDSVFREQAAIETDIAGLAALVDAARKLAGMRHPSVERLLARQGFGFEANRVAELVQVIDRIDRNIPKNDGD
jgi:hypothetical protein